MLHGRTIDAFRLPTGDRVTTRRVDECFAGVSGFAHYQLIQNTTEPWILRFVPETREPEGATLSKLAGELGELLQTTTPIALQKTDMLGPEKSGKFRLGYPSRRAG